MTYKKLITGVRDSSFGENCLVADSVNIYEATFGNDCFIGPWVEVQARVVIGSRVRLQSHSLICEGMTIGDDTFVGHGVMTANSKYPKVGLKDWECLPPKIGSGVSIGSNTTILPGVNIGDNSVIGAGCVISKDVPKNSVVVSSSKMRFLEEQ